MAFFLHRCYWEGAGKIELSAHLGEDSDLGEERSYLMRMLPRAVVRNLATGKFWRVHWRSWPASRSPGRAARRASPGPPAPSSGASSAAVPYSSPNQAGGVTGAIASPHQIQPDQRFREWVLQDWAVNTSRLE